MTTMYLVHELPAIADRRGSVFWAGVFGAPGENGLWEAVLHFRGEDGAVITTPIETRQPKLSDLVFWATALTPVYVERALARAASATAAVGPADEATVPVKSRASRVVERGLAARSRSTGRRGPGAAGGNARAGSNGARTAGSNTRRRPAAGR